jgi:hypothetical protein
MNDIGRRRSGGGADETFDGADTVAAARDEVPVSSSFDITPPMATAVVVIVIVLPSLADRRRRRPRPPPPARTPILERETRPREATRKRQRPEINPVRAIVVGASRTTGINPPPPSAPQQHQRRDSPHVSKSGGGQADAALVGLVDLSTTLAFPSGNNFPISPLHFRRLWASTTAKGDYYREGRSQCEHSSNDRKRRRCVGLDGS